MQRTRPFAVRLKSPVCRLVCLHDEVVIETGDGGGERFDHAIVATHADQALAMLEEPSSARA